MKSISEQKRTLVVFTHPNTQSFNHDVLATVVETLKSKGHSVKIRDLYKGSFNPVLAAPDFVSFQKGVTPQDIASEQELLTWANHLVFIYPVWWWDRPALLKGWIDRVLAHGFAFRSNAGKAEGLLNHEKCLVVITSGNPLEEMKRTGADEVVRKSMTDGTLVYCGIKNVQSVIYGSIPRISDEERQKNLSDIRDNHLQSW